MENTKKLTYSINQMPFLVKGIFFVLWFVLAQNAYGQFFDSIQTSLEHPPRPEVKFDSRNSFIGARYARIYGIKAGLDYNGTFKFGLGYNWLSSDVFRTMSIRNSRGEVEEVKAQYTFNYLSPYAEYVFYKKEPWNISVSALLGFGRANYAYFDSYWVHTSTNPDFVMVYEPYMTARYRLFKYIGVGAGVGYRLAVSQDKFSKSRLNSPIYVIKLRLYLADLYRDLM